MAKWVLDTFEGTKTWYSDDVVKSAINEIDNAISGKYSGMLVEDFLLMVKTILQDGEEDEDK